jgi:hypothetical protein
LGGELAVETSAAALAGKPKPSHAKFPGTLEMVSTQPGNTARNASQRPASLQLEPGVYKTEPFECLVVVPGPQADDAMIAQPPAGEIQMWSIAPDLRFIPINPKRK